ncbi:hypothetical protein DICPUDRAFT_57949 [Dictyostelium purpureum]|uniref:Choline transporter-like protein n=1 Tax=Dictyostelium purpureum TaxID=5786 RepID=F0ZYD0_DICPU|nr:uncharacterized protein DICPUDRAFT_57949 [Dictyostelium purpureum]EGC31065.1 hypothetical protein DICPUDRAFT_57949 [Dictyostelium purpureum]|eukprot:XP_003292424.1 hypothetical protein DICPUDRAFT_57949 [Dictyostelium purpureum]
MGSKELKDHDEISKKVIKKKGVYKKRKCQDCFFLLLFLAFWAGMIVIAVYGVNHGNPQRLVKGTDSYGNICGVNNIEEGKLNATQARDLRDKKYVYFIYYTELSITLPTYRVVCVDECPNETFLIPQNETELICDYDTVPSLEAISPNGTCMGKISSSPFINRCLPNIIVNGTQTIADKIYQFVNNELSKDTSVKVLTDLATSWRYLIYGALIAMGLGLVWIFLLRFFAGLITWLTVFAAYACLGLLTAQVYFQWQKASDRYDETPPSQRLTMQEDNILALKVIFIILCVICGIFALILLALFSRIRIAIRIIKESSRAVGIMPSIFFFPVFIFILLAGFILYWVYIGIYLGTAGEPEYDENYRFIGYNADDTLRKIQIYHFFGFLWTIAFILALNQTTIAGAVASWYWVHDKKDTPFFPVWASLWRVIRYHLGSVAFGSLILAIVQFIRWVLRFLEKKFKGKEAYFARFIVRCLNCIFGCFERFIKFLDKNAYIMISIYGYSFCEGAKRGFQLILTNILRVAAVNMVSSFLMFLGRIFITAATVGISLYLLERFENLTFYVIPAILIGFIAFAISTGFMSVYDMTIDTILLCFCEDCERNDGSAERPYFMSKRLQKFVK